jgi:hypothetical protein
VSGLSSRADVADVRRRATRFALPAALVWFALACSAQPTAQESKALRAPNAVEPTVATAIPAARRAPAAAMSGRALGNRFAYIPPQCYTRTRDAAGQPRNPCFVCHTQGLSPNYVDDSDLQEILKLPPAAAVNPWTNLFSPAIERAPPASAESTLAYVRASNYFDAAGNIALAARLAALPQEWDGDGDAHWDGFVPDAWFSFDARGYDHRPDGSASGWRAFAYYPLPGAFFPTNGSIGDVLIRLDPSLRENADGQPDARVTDLNLAIVEALITRRDVAIEATSERTWSVDLDLDGELGVARRVAFQANETTTRMQYVGRAQALSRAGRFPIAPGLFPLGTEFLHSLRYLDVSEHGEVSMAKRMKELRYTKKVRWFSAADLKAHAAAETIEQLEAPGGALDVLWEFDRGVYNRQGWLLQAFIEDRTGSLRPETYEETAFCVGCHGGVGATTDSMFSFARKLSNPALGYFHWTQRDLRGLPEPRRADGSFEYTFYLQQNRAGDEFRDNAEVEQKFFDKGHALRRERVRALHDDIATLLMPSASRALALDRAYRAVVLEQSFVRGRDATLAATTNVQRQVSVLAPTGITHPVRISPARSRL